MYNIVTASNTTPVDLFLANNTESQIAINLQPCQIAISTDKNRLNFIDANGTAQKVMNTVPSAYTGNLAKFDDDKNAADSGLGVGSVQGAVNLAHTANHAINSSYDHSSTITAGKVIIADSNGLPSQGTNSNNEIASAVTNTHIKQHPIASANDHSSTITPNKVYSADSSGLPKEGALSDNGSIVTSTGDIYINKNSAAIFLGTTAPLIDGGEGDPQAVVCRRLVPDNQGSMTPKNTELILANFNDGTNASGIDKVTLRAPMLSLQTFNDDTIIDIDNVNGYNERYSIDPNGGHIITAKGVSFRGLDSTAAINSNMPIEVVNNEAGSTVKIDIHTVGVVRHVITGSSSGYNDYIKVFEVKGTGSSLSVPTNNYASGTPAMILRGTKVGSVTKEGGYIDFIADDGGSTASGSDLFNFKNNDDIVCRISNNGDVSYNGEVSASTILAFNTVRATGTSHGSVLNKMTTADRLAIYYPEDGEEVYDTDLRTKMYYNGYAGRWLYPDGARAKGAFRRDIMTVPCAITFPGIADYYNVVLIRQGSGRHCRYNAIDGYYAMVDIINHISHSDTTSTSTGTFDVIWEAY